MDVQWAVDKGHDHFLAIGLHPFGIGHFQADTNNGKTALAKKFLRDLNKSTPKKNKDAAQIPGIHVQCPPSPNFNMLLSAIFREVDAPCKTTGRIEPKVHQLVRLAPSIGLRIIIIDEFHNLLSGTQKQQSDFLITLKWLTNELRMPIVTMGTRESTRVLQTDPQLANRFRPYVLHPWKDLKEYAKFLAQFYSSMKLTGKNPFNSTKLVNKFLAMSEGLTGESVDLMRVAASLALEKGVETIDINLMDEVDWIMPTNRRDWIG